MAFKSVKGFYDRFSICEICNDVKKITIIGVDSDRTHKNLMDKEIFKIEDLSIKFLNDLYNVNHSNASITHFYINLECLNIHSKTEMIMWNEKSDIKIYYDLYYLKDMAIKIYDDEKKYYIRI